MGAGGSAGADGAAGISGVAACSGDAVRSGAAIRMVPKIGESRISASPEGSAGCGRRGRGWTTP